MNNINRHIVKNFFCLFRYFIFTYAIRWISILWKLN